MATIRRSTALRAGDRGEVYEGLVTDPRDVADVLGGPEGGSW
ncbi:hypothetical protein QMZ92_22650 [Streptomyces sp. HNM0645]|nr:hypothetical protein [Streptomyces sp. HNM0645]MDI9887093.1 hypothetical protein [Streptomyces sp. HNM0645]